MRVISRYDNDPRVLGLVKEQVAATYDTAIAKITPGTTATAYGREDAALPAVLFDTRCRLTPIGSLESVDQNLRELLKDRESYKAFFDPSEFRLEADDLVAVAVSTAQPGGPQPTTFPVFQVVSSAMLRGGNHVEMWAVIVRDSGNREIAGSVIPV